MNARILSLVELFFISEMLDEEAVFLSYVRCGITEA